MAVFRQQTVRDLTLLTKLTENAILDYLVSKVKALADICSSLLETKKKYLIFAIHFLYHFW